MPHHYKQYAVGSPEYKKAYAEHMMKKLKKKRGRGGYDHGYDKELDSSPVPPDPNPPL